MRVTSLGSGSSGNALLVEAGPRRRTKLLIDAGFPGRILCQRLWQAGVTPAELQGICITHEHTDHIIGLPWLAKQSPAPIIADPRTLALLKQQFTAGIVYSDYGTPISLAAESESVCDEPALISSISNGSVHYNSESAQRISGPLELLEPLDVPERATAFTSLPLDAGARRVVGDIEIISLPPAATCSAPPAAVSVSSSTVARLLRPCLPPSAMPTCSSSSPITTANACCAAPTRSRSSSASSVPLATSPTTRRRTPSCKPGVPTACAGSGSRTSAAPTTRPNSPSTTSANASPPRERTSLRPISPFSLLIWGPYGIRRSYGIAGRCGRCKSMIYHRYIYFPIPAC